MDPNQTTRPLIRVGFGSDFNPPEKFGSVPGQAQTRPVDTPNYDFVNGLGLPIPLGVSWGRIFICNSQITTVSSERFAIKLKSIVQDEGARDPESGDNVFPDKLFGVHISDIRQGFHFNPFSEIVYVDQQISLVPYCLGERANNIQARLSKWLRAGQGIKGSSRLVYVWCESLTLIALLHVFLCFLLHIWPPIALNDSFVRQRSSSSVASTDPFM